jgi:glyoxylase-like metal-dependent hydrolase (beta-lactamase superfamily II)
MVDVDEVAENIYLIDNQVCSIPKLGSVYLLNEEKKALVDSGPPSSASVVLDGIRKVGVRPEDINYIIVTHIHLDHAGGAGVLLKDMPRAQVVVHHKGARHLIKLAELMESATKTQGAEIIALYGEVVPVEPERVREVYDNDTIKLSEKQVLDFIDAPGHAPHELCIYERRNGGLFTGDTLGLYFAEDEVLLPCHPPPSFDLEVSINTIQRLMKLKANMIYGAHFGASNKVQETLRLAIDKLQIFGNIVAKAIKDNALDSVAEGLMAQARADLEPLKKLPSRYEFVTENILSSCLAGFIHYYQGRYKAGLTK